MDGTRFRPALWAAGLLWLLSLPACRSSPLTALLSDPPPVVVDEVPTSPPASAPAEDVIPPWLQDVRPDSPEPPPWQRRTCQEWLADGWRETCATLKEQAHLAWQDQKHYYSPGNLALLALGIGVAAPLANTPADEYVSDWYRDKVRSPRADEVSRWAKLPGDYPLMLPLILGATVGGKLTEDTPGGALAFDWGSRSCRALLAGAPTIGILQVGLGAGRPGEDPAHWHPFNDKNGASGHAFVAAVPFLTAARMADRRAARFGLAAVSTLPTWSRFNDDGHYLSQAWLGWWVAYLSIRSVDRTERERRIEFVPACEGTTGPGISLLFRY